MTVIITLFAFATLVARTMGIRSMGQSFDLDDLDEFNATGAGPWGQPPPPDHTVVWTDSTGAKRQAYFWLPAAQPPFENKLLAVALFHGIFAGLTAKLSDFGPLTSVLRHRGYPVCGFDHLDHGKTRFLSPEFAGKNEEEIACMHNSGFNMTNEKGEEYMTRYVLPVVEFPDFCGEVLESLMEVGEKALQVVDVGQSWGGNLVMMALQQDPIKVSPRLRATITTNMGLDSLKFSGPGLGAWFMKKGRNFAMKSLSKNKILKTGVRTTDCRLKGLDPDLPPSTCPEIEHGEKEVTLGFGKYGIDASKLLHKRDKKGGTYQVSMPTLHQYCDSDPTIVPRYINRAALKYTETFPKQAACLQDVSLWGQCAHSSFPLRLQGWDLNMPWVTLFNFLEAVRLCGDGKCPFLCPALTITTKIPEKK